MELESYFTPTKNSVELMFGNDTDAKLSNSIVLFDKNSSVVPEDFDVAIIGVEASSDNNNAGCAKAPDSIRTKLYGLRDLDRELKIIDFGNIKGNTVKDKYVALKEVISFLLQNTVIPLVIGGSQDFTVSMADAFSSMKNNWNFSVIDSKIDLITEPYNLNSHNFLGKLFSRKKHLIDGFTLIGAQKYLYSYDQEQFINNNYFNLLRLGELKNEELKEAEPYLRDTDLLSVDISSVKGSDMPAQARAMPNGLFSHEICQLARYAGLSDRLKALGLFELNPDFDNDSGSGVFLGAQLIWFFLEGVSMRHNDFPVRDIESYSIYIVPLENYEVDIRFFNNPHNGRWWVEVPGEEGITVKSCCKQDYDDAIRNIIPEKWIISFKKSNSKSGTKKNNFIDSD